MKNKATLRNIILSLLQQIVGLVSGLIIPRLILSTFGSDVNGLSASISQFLNYIAIIEGGVTGVISANLYKPLVERDWVKMSSVLTTARSFYRKIGGVFIVYTIVVAIAYPRVVNTGYRELYVFILTCVLSVGLLLQYMFSITSTTILNADKKGYIVSALSIILTIGNIGLVFLVVHYYPDIILLKMASAALFALQPFFLGLYVNKNYQIDWKAPKDNSLVEQRWSGFSINFAFFIHTCTDVTVLTLMSDLKTVSIYSVYFMVVNKISVLIHAIASGIEPTIGQAYAKNDVEELHKKMDLFEFIVFFSIGILFSLLILLINPFVQMYTKGVTDTNYYQPVFGVILIISEGLYLIKYPHVSLAYSANKFRELTIPAYTEAIINIIVSVALVKPFGLVGIAIGTTSGMLYRMIFHIHFTKKILADRKQTIFYKKFFIILIATTIGVFFCLSIYPMRMLTITSWIIHAMIYGVIMCVIFVLVCMFFFKKEIILLKNYLRKNSAEV